MTYDRQKVQAELDAIVQMLDGAISEVHGALRRIDKLSGAMGMLQAMVAEFDKEPASAEPDVIG